MKDPTPEQLARLPTWARDHIRSITRQRDNATKTMREMEAAQKPAPWFTEDMDNFGEVASGGSLVTQTVRYFTCWRMQFFHRGLYVEFIVRDDGLHIQYSGAKDRHNRFRTYTPIVLQPQSRDLIALLFPNKKDE